MATWVVSAHGASYGAGPSKIRQLVQLPVGVMLFFFEKENAALPIAKSWQIYNLVMKQRPTPQDFLAIAQIPGYHCFKQPALPDYAIIGDDTWIDRHKQPASGIFVFGDTFHQSPLTMYIKSNEQYSLSQFFNDPAVTWKPGDRVYWLACRSWL